jgi:hypothetical protein
MRPILLTAVCVLALSAAEAQPKADPAVREVETQIRAKREAAIAADPVVAKLKREADEARQHFETALEQKLREDADYLKLKARLEELRGRPAKGRAPAEGQPPAPAPAQPGF